MNGNTSTAGCKSPERLPDTAALEHQWKTIDWKKAEAVVSRLQARIAKATQEKKWNTVKRLQYLLTHSYYAKVLAIRKVTTNKGKNTPGIDKELWKTPASKMRGALICSPYGRQGNKERQEGNGETCRSRGSRTTAADKRMSSEADAHTGSSATRWSTSINNREMDQPLRSRGGSRASR